MINNLAIIYVLIKLSLLGLVNLKIVTILNIPIIYLIDIVVFAVIVLSFFIGLRAKSVVLNKNMLILIFFYSFYLLISLYFYGFSNQVFARFFESFTFITALWLFSKSQFLLQFSILRIFVFICSLFYILANTYLPDAFPYLIYSKNSLSFPGLIFTVIILYISQRTDQKLMLVEHVMYFLALYISGFRSILILYTVLFIVGYFRRDNRKFTKGSIILISSLMFVMAASIFFNDAAIVSRLSVNVIRFEYITKRPFIGYGFVDINNVIFESLRNASLSRFDSTLNVVDSGWVDGLARFGLIGLTIYIIALYRLVVPYPVSFYDKYFFICVGIASLTLSIITYPVGLVPLGMLAGLKSSYTIK